MSSSRDLFLTALAPLIWGSTYLVTSEYLPADYPITVALLRALPAGILLLLVVRHLPPLNMYLKLLVLGGLNFALFWWLLFEAAYRLPGGVAATVGAIQPLIVMFFARVVLGSPVRALAVVAALTGIAGVALLILTPDAALDSHGLMAGLSGAVAMAAGTVLSRHWQPDVSPLTFTAWQLMAGGLLLLPAALWFEPSLPSLTQENALAFVYLGLIGAALTYVLWFRGVARLEPALVSTLGFLSPISAVAIGWWALGQGLSGFQVLGVVIVLMSVVLSNHANQKSTTGVPVVHEGSLVLGGSK